MKTSLRGRHGLLFRPIPGTTECPLCGVGSPHEHTPQERVIFSNGLKKGRAENLVSGEKELSEAQLYNAYSLGFSMVDYSCGNAAQHTSGLRAVIKAYKNLNKD